MSRLYSQFVTRPSDPERNETCGLVFSQDAIPVNQDQAGTALSPLTCAEKEICCRLHDKPCRRQIGHSASKNGGSCLPVRRLSRQSSPLPKKIRDSTLLEHIASSRFFQHYVSPNRSFYCLGEDFVSAVIDKSENRTMLSEAIVSLGILTLPTDSPLVKFNARTKYSKALKLVNEALVKDDVRQSDEVLLAVILIGLFETTPDEAHSMSNWKLHLEGALQLILVRGAQVVRRRTTYGLFNVLRAQILLNSFITGRRVPKGIVDLSEDITESQSEDDRVASRLACLFARMCDIMATARRQPPPTDPGRLLSEAVILDDELITWASSLPKQYRFAAMKPPPSSNAYSDTCHVYQSNFAAEVWMLYRTARFTTSSLIAAMYSSIQEADGSAHGEDTTERTANADVVFWRQEHLQVMDLLRKDMCDAIPFSLNQHVSPPPKIADLPLNRRTPAINFLMYILKTDGLPEDMQTWATKLLLDLQTAETIDKGAIWMNRPGAAHEG